MPKEYESDDERSPLEIVDAAHEQLVRAVKRSKRLTHWYWRLWEWLKAVRWCLKQARQEFIDVYRARNE